MGLSRFLLLSTLIALSLGATRSVYAAEDGGVGASSLGYSSIAVTVEPYVKVTPIRFSEKNFAVDASGIEYDIVKVNPTEWLSQPNSTSKEIQRSARVATLVIMVPR